MIMSWKVVEKTQKLFADVARDELEKNKKESEGGQK